MQLITTKLAAKATTTPSTPSGGGKGTGQCGQPQTVPYSCGAKLVLQNTCLPYYGQSRDGNLPAYFSDTPVGVSLEGDGGNPATAKDYLCIFDELDPSVAPIPGVYSNGTWVVDFAPLAANDPLLVAAGSRPVPIIGGIIIIEAAGQPDLSGFTADLTYGDTTGNAAGQLTGGVLNTWDYQVLRNAQRRVTLLGLSVQQSSATRNVKRVWAPPYSFTAGAPNVTRGIRFRILGLPAVQANWNVRGLQLTRARSEAQPLFRALSLGV